MNHFRTNLTNIRIMEIRTSRGYTKEELRYVQDNYHTKTIKELAEHLNRTEYGLKFQLSKWVNRGELERKKPQTAIKKVKQSISYFFTWDEYRFGVIAPE